MSIPISKQARAILTGLVETFDAIDRVNGLEQREAQLQASVAELTASTDAQRAELAKEANNTALARSEALAIVEQAKVDAETIKAKADAEARQIREAALEVAKAAKAKENASEAAERKAKAGLKEAEEKTEAAAKSLAEIEKKIEDAKAAARAHFGA